MKSPAKATPQVQPLDQKRNGFNALHIYFDSAHYKNNRVPLDDPRTNFFIERKIAQSAMDSTTKKTMAFFVRNIQQAVDGIYTPASVEECFRATFNLPIANSDEAAAKHFKDVMMSICKAPAWLQLPAQDKVEFCARWDLAVKAMGTESELSNAKFAEIWSDDKFRSLHLQVGDFDCDKSSVLNRKNAVVLLGDAVTQRNKEIHAVR